LVLLAGSARAEGVGAPTEQPSTGVDAKARELFQAGQAAYDRKAYGAAAALFRQSYAIVASPALLYDLAQAERLAGECSAALVHYRQFAAASPSALPADIEDKIAEVERCSAASSAGNSLLAQPKASDPTGGPRARPSAPRRAPAAERPPAWVGWTSASVGIAALIAAGVMTGMVVHRQSVVEQTCPGKICRSQSGIDAASEGQALFIGSLAAYGVGAAGLAVGVYVWSQDSHASGPGARALFSPRQAVLTWTRAF
jgi:hypothetical protein